MKEMVLLIALVAVCSTALAAPKQEVKTEILLQQTGSWNDIPYRAYPSGAPELTVKKMIIPPHTALPWHTHPAPNAAYILSGHLTVEDRATGRTAVYRAGQAFAESVNSVHRGRTDDEPAVVIVTYAGVPGEELSKPITPAGE